LLRGDPSNAGVAPNGEVFADAQAVLQRRIARMPWVRPAGKDFSFEYFESLCYIFNMKKATQLPLKTKKFAVSQAALRSPNSAQLRIGVQVNPLMAVVLEHVALSPESARRIKAKFVYLLKNSTSITNIELDTQSDRLLTTQQAANLVGVSRPYIVARIDSGEIQLHSRVGNQRRVLQSSVQLWQLHQQATSCCALEQLGAELDREIFCA
jgi:excisionase family DNA binding protein